MSTLKESKSFSQSMTEWKEFFWNPRTHEFMGRTAGSWALILLFYLIFYGFLTGLFCLTMWVLLQTVDDYRPKYQDRVANPGLMIRPKTDTLNVVFNVTSTETWDGYVNAINIFLNPYNDTIQSSTNDQCIAGRYYKQDDNVEVRNNPKRACQFNRTVLQNCSGLEDKTYGYSEGKPCILIKMNRIIGLLPGAGIAPYVTCEGKKDDSSKLHELAYFPQNGTFDLMYFPYYGKKAHVNYTQPLVAVKFLNITYNVDINVECKIHANNIKNNDDRDKFAGRVSFILRINKD
ncbi:sodium/potassium-transporting ATPase subunit beta-2 isoform X1 [Latimeria chalumnae]|uniref:sodium/potassium-transporting ATPase subunit beta-2 isoform X1 n=1 Tax=Latimeria chalumnae TaxID=7897 RepID=UPI00313F35C7